MLSLADVWWMFLSDDLWIDVKGRKPDFHIFKLILIVLDFKMSSYCPLIPRRQEATGFHHLLF